MQKVKVMMMLAAILVPLSAIGDTNVKLKQEDKKLEVEIQTDKKASIQITFVDGKLAYTIDSDTEASEAVKLEALKLERERIASATKLREEAWKTDGDKKTSK
jgi:hypothetical protein